MKFLAVLLAAWMLVAYLAFPCGIPWALPVFSFHRHPDLPRNHFLAGDLGILEPTYARSYLWVAYRHLADIGFNPAQQEQVRLYWADRLTGDWDGNHIDWLDRWKTARARILGVSAPKDEPKSRPAYPWIYYRNLTKAWQVNCADDAFRVAIDTLHSRTARFGRTRDVNNWIEGQEAVFANCLSDQPSFPKDAPPGAPDWLKRDRAYQLAAAALYANQTSQAEARFRAIAADQASPWHTLAPYLVVRVLVRAWNRTASEPGDARTQLELYDKAEKEIQHILAGPRMAPLHGMTRAIWRRIRQRSKPQLALRELAPAILVRDASGSLRQDIWDYTTLLDHFLDEPYYFRTDLERRQYLQERQSLPRTDDLTDWIVTFQSRDPRDTRHAVARWRAKKSLPWLLAALARVDANDPASPELIEASLNTPPRSPAYWTLAYHRNRLRIERSDNAAARAELRTILDQPPVPIPKSAVNHFRALRMQTAPDLAGFLDYAQRVPLMIVSDRNTGEEPNFDYFALDVRLPRLDTDSIKVLNERTPMYVWKKALRHGLPSHLQQEWALAAFARATLLRDDDGMREVAPFVHKAFPESAKYLTAFSNDSTPQDRHFAAVYFLLHYSNVRPYLTSGVAWRTPSIRRIDSYVNNWWCSLDSDNELDWDASDRVVRWITTDPPERPKRADPDLAAGRVSFLTPSDIAAGKAELEKLTKAGTALRFLGTEALLWARKHPDDPRNPESLAFVVKVGHYACSDAKTATLTRDAFNLLHVRYATSLWAKTTPYWYR